MGDALLWIVGILVVGYIAWNWLVIPGLTNAIGRFGGELDRNPKLKSDFQQLGNDLKKPPHPAAMQHHPTTHQANYGYYYY
jgi:hypothetical protein